MTNLGVAMLRSQSITTLSLLLQHYSEPLTSAGPCDQARPDAVTTNPKNKNAMVRYPITTAM